MEFWLIREVVIFVQMGSVIAEKSFQIPFSDGQKGPQCTLFPKFGRITST